MKFLKECLNGKLQNLWWRGVYFVRSNFEMTPLEAYKYAYYVLQGPYPEGESLIAENYFLSYMYARYVIGRRFLAGEPTIAKDSLYAFFYARDVIRGRWLEAEGIISNSIYADEYCSFFGVKLGKVDWVADGF